MAKPVKCATCREEFPSYRAFLAHSCCHILTHNVIFVQQILLYTDAELADQGVTLVSGFRERMTALFSGSR